MKLAGYTIDLAAVPYEEGRRATHIILRLRTDDGLEGLGYTTLTTAAAWQAKPVVATLEALLARIIGADPMPVEAIGATLLAMGDGGPLAGLVARAVSVIDVALWDIKGKALGQPVWKLLGGYRDRVPVYASWKLWWNYDLDTLAKHAAEAVALGFCAMKFRLGGVLDPAVAATRTRVLRETVGDSIDLMADANQSWNVAQSIAIGRALEPYRLFWLEDPLHYLDFAGMAAVAAAIPMPLATGESHHSMEPFRDLLEQRATGRLIVDLDVGGLTQWMKVAHLAQAYRMDIAGHTAPEVLMHAVAAAPNGLTVEYIPWFTPLLKQAPKLEAGMLVLPDAPGLSIELDEAALQHYRVE